MLTRARPSARHTASLRAGIRAVAASAAIRAQSAITWTVMDAAPARLPLCTRIILPLEVVRA